VTGESRSACLILNPTAAGGRAAKLLPDAIRQLDALGLRHRVVEARDIAHATDAAREAAGADEVVVAMGGDGLVGALAGAIRQDGVLGVLPAGRGNDFARELGIPKDMPAACRVLANGVERRLDLGEVNGTAFACIASTGFDSEANRIANEARIVKGNLVYLYAALRALAAWRPARFTVVLDGVEHEFEGYTLVIANTRYYGGGMEVAPEAEPDDATFEIVFIGNNSKLRFLANLPKVFAGKHVDADSVSTHRARAVEVKANRPFAVYADGEHLSDLPATVRVLPGAIRVLVPH
jgi:YegS/Rv2252/BmrU family lipid kinase